MSAGRVLFICDGDEESMRRRALYPAEAMSSLGVQSDVVQIGDAGVEEFAADADAVVLVGLRDGNEDLLERLRQRSVPLFFDVNDPLDPALSILRHSDTVLCATQQLADVITRDSGRRTIVLPNGVSRRVARLAALGREHEVLAVRSCGNGAASDAEADRGGHGDQSGLPLSHGSSPPGGNTAGP